MNKKPVNIQCGKCGSFLPIVRERRRRLWDYFEVWPCQKCSKDLNIITSAEPITEQDLDNLAWWRNGD